MTRLQKADYAALSPSATQIVDFNKSREAFNLKELMSYTEPFIVDTGRMSIEFYHSMLLILGSLIIMFLCSWELALAAIGSLIFIGLIRFFCVTRKDLQQAENATKTQQQLTVIANQSMKESAFISDSVRKFSMHNNEMGDVSVSHALYR